MVSGKYEARNLSGLKVFKGTAYGPADYLSEGAKRSRRMTQEEMDRYDRKVTRSKGFDVDGCTGCLPGRISPISSGSEEWQTAQLITRWAAYKYGGQRLEDLELVKANKQPVSGVMYYITFNAFDTVDNQNKFYRTKVYRRPGLPGKMELEYFKESKPPKKAGTPIKAQGSMSQSNISEAEKKFKPPKKAVTTQKARVSLSGNNTSKAKKGTVVRAACALPGFTAFLLKIKSHNPSMTHGMARFTASKKWKMLLNAEKQAFISEAGLKTKN